ncbi:MAG: hypothetical protein ABFS38_16680 [Bacteroidota bacterium]
MALSKITRIILYLVAGISLLVVLFFYIGPKTVDDYDALVDRVDDALMPMDLTPVAPLVVIDTTLTDSADIAENLAAVEKANEERLAAPVVTDNSGTSIKDVTSGWEYLLYFRTDIALIWAYILIVLTLIASIVFPLISVLSNPKGLIRLGAVLAGAAILVVISYVMSKGTPIDIIGYTGTDNSDPGTLKMIDTVLFVTYILFGMALASILYAIISKAFK